jgi:hypothetical protein
MPDVQVLEKKFTAKEFAEIRQAIMQVEKHNPSGSAATNNPPYGPYADGSGDYGVFSYPGTRPNMFSAFSRPRSFASILGVRPSRVANEKIGIMTGITDSEGSNPSDFCGVAPTAGQLKLSVQNYIWGKSYWKSKVVNIAETGEYADYGDMVAKRIENVNQSRNPFIPDMMNKIDISNRDGATLANELATTGAAMERSWEIVAVQGNSTKSPAQAQRGWIREFDGLERQITTGKRDLDTQVLSPAVDSQVIAWNSGIDVSVSGRSFPMALTDTYWGMNQIARDVGMDGVTFAWLMRAEQFHALTYIYACEYWTARCPGSAGNPSFTDAAAVRGLQLEMMDGQYLKIDGKNVPVIFSDGISLTKSGGSVYTASSTFLLPIEWNGIPLLNLQYKPMDNADAMQFANFVGPNEFMGLNGGMWLATKQRSAYCMELLFAGKFRLIQDAPFLAAVINNTQFTFQAPIRNAYPTMTEFYRNGGASRWDGNMTVS